MNVPGLKSCRLLSIIFTALLMVSGSLAIAQNDNCNAAELIAMAGPANQVTTSGQSEFWYTYTTPDDGTADDITVVTSEMSLAIDLYTGSCGSPITEASEAGGSLVALNISPNTQVWIKFGPEVETAGSFDLFLTLPGGAANDNCANASAASTGPNSISATQTEYWYTYTTASTGGPFDVQASLTGATIEMHLGSCASPTGSTGGLINTAQLTSITTNTQIWIKLSGGDYNGQTLLLVVTDNGGGNTAPTDITITSTSVNENLVGPVVGDLGTVDPDNMDTFTYTLVAGTGDTDNLSFDILSGNQLVITATLDYETKTSYSVRVRSTDFGGLNFEKAFTINVNNLAELASVNTNGLATSVTSSSATIPGQVVNDNGAAVTERGIVIKSGSAPTSTTDGTKLSAATAGTGAFTVNATGLTGSTTYYFKVYAINAAGTSYSDDLNFTTNAPTIPSLTTSAASSPTASSATLGGNVTDANGAPVTERGVVYATTASPTTANTKLQSGTGTGSFSVSATGLTATTQYFVRAYAINSAGTAYGNEISFTTPSANSAPTDIKLSVSTIAENSAVGTLVGTLTTTDAGDSHTYTENSTFFKIDGNKLILSKSPDFETIVQNPIRVEIKTTDQGDLSYTESFSITVTDVNEAPRYNIEMARKFEENIADLFVESVKITDPDKDDVLTYSFIENDNDWPDYSFFELVENKIFFKQSPNFEDKNNYRFIVKVSDIAGLSAQATVGVTIIDVNEAPTDIRFTASIGIERTGLGFSIPENYFEANDLGGSRLVALFTTEDPDVSDVFTYAMGSGEEYPDNKVFKLANLGNDELLAPVLDYETKPQFKISIVTKDLKGLSYEEEFIIDVTDVNEAPNSISLDKTSVDENVAAGTLVATIVATDPDANNTLTYSLVNGGIDNASFTIDGNSLKISASPDFETKKEYKLKLKVADQAGLFLEKDFTITVNDMDEPTDPVTTQVVSVPGGRWVDVSVFEDDQKQVVAMAKYSWTNEGTLIETCSESQCRTLNYDQIRVNSNVRIAFSKSLGWFHIYKGEVIRKQENGQRVRILSSANPSDIAVGKDGAIYIALENRILKIPEASYEDATVKDVAQWVVAGTGKTRIAALSIGNATKAKEVDLTNITALAVADDGVIYFAEDGQPRIFKIDTQGIISIVAGTGFSGSMGDGQVATGATLGKPVSLAVDKNSNLYIAIENYGPDHIRMVDKNGIIRTVIGLGGQIEKIRGTKPELENVEGIGGIDIDDAGNLYFIARNRVHKAKYIAKDPPKITFPNIYKALGEAAFDLAATSNSTGEITYEIVEDKYNTGTTLNGKTVTLGSKPGTITLRAKQLATATHNAGTQVAKLTIGAIITTVAGGAQFSTSFSPASFNSTKGDGGFATGAILNNPYAVTVDGLGNLYIASTTDNRIFKVNSDGKIIKVAGTGTPGYSGDGGPAIDARLNNPSGLSVDVSGNLYIADRYNNRIRKVGTDGVITTVAGIGSASYSGDGGPASSAGINSPTGVANDVQGNLYIADRYNSRIRKVDTDGKITTVAGTGASGFSGDDGLAVNAQLYWPFGVVIDGQGNLYIADYSNDRIRKVDTNGNITTVAGTGTSGFSGDDGSAVNAKLSSPSGIGLDGQGNLFISEYGNSRIRMVGTDGVITTVAGTGTSGYSGDGGQATMAAINRPLGLAVDVQGNVYIPDTFNHRIRKVGLAASCEGVVARTISKVAVEGNLGAGYIDLKSSVATDNQWYKNGIAIAGATEQTLRVPKSVTDNFTVAQAGTFCPNAQSEAVKPSGRTGAQNGAQQEEEADQAEEDSLQDIAHEISAWPNPVSGTLQVEGITPEARLQMLNIDGRELSAPTHYANGQAVIDMQGMAPGTYVLRVADGKQVKVIRIVKSH